MTSSSPRRPRGTRSTSRIPPDAVPRLRTDPPLHLRHGRPRSHRGPCKDISSVECFAHYRQGYCQFYATTMAIFLREQGIPSRIVKGFLPGERSATGEEPIGNGQSHQWVEVYFPGYGWVPFDPTGGDGRQAARPAVRAAASRAPRGRCRASPCRRGSATTSSASRTRSRAAASDDVEQPRGAADRHRDPAAGRSSARWRSSRGSAGPRSGTTADHAYRHGHPALRPRFGFGPRPTQTVFEFSGSARGGAAERAARARDWSRRPRSRPPMAGGILGDGPPAGAQGRGAAAEA